MLSKLGHEQFEKWLITVKSPVTGVYAVVISQGAVVSTGGWLESWSAPQVCPPVAQNNS